MTEILTTVELPAAPEKVWAMLTAFSEYERWHPLLRLEGTAELGAEIAYSRRYGLNSPRWLNTEAEIVDCVAPSRLEWRIGMPSIFASREIFEIEPIPDGSLLTHRTRMSGLLGSAVGAISRSRIRASMELFDGLLARRFLGGDRGAKASAVGPNRGNRIQRRRRSRVERRRAK